MNIERAITIPGWMDETSELPYLAHLASTHSAVAEVGTWQGRSTRAIADNLVLGGTIHCIDTWADNAYGGAPAEITCYPEWLWKEFTAHHTDTIASGTVIPHRMASIEAAAHIASLGLTFDMIFIDADHEYPTVKADILAWRPLLKQGGVLCGHDLYPNGPFWPGVLQAVNELVPNYRVVGTIWTTEGV